MARGGKRQGTPGRGYANRTDLMTNYDQSAPHAAAPPPAAPAQQQQLAPQFLRPDDIPKPDDPTGRPNEPITAGLDSGMGAGSEALGPIPPSQATQDVMAAYLAFPTPQLRRAIQMLRNVGAL